MGKAVLQMKETYHPIVNWVDEVRKFLSNEVGKENNWDIDEIYITFRRGPRDDQGETLAAHIKTRQEASYAPSASWLFYFLLVRVGFAGRYRHVRIALLAFRRDM